MPDKSSNINFMQEQVSTEGLYKPAYPACRVFIYGFEVSSDVVSFNVTQSGGSIERSPSVCSIMFANKDNKYTITHDDIIKIAKARKAISDSKSKASNENSVIYPLGGDQPGIDFSSEFIDETIYRLSLASDDELVYLLGAMGFTNITIDDAKAVMYAIKMEKASRSSTGESNDFIMGSWNEGELSYNIKQQVVMVKSLYKTQLSSSENMDLSFLNYEDRLAFDYPYQEGDCIFHFNDPVRVVVRDPFDPRIWYWEFTGFVDVLTNNIGMNLDSLVSITCTDVTKPVRYAVTQLNAYGLDANISNVLKMFDQSGNNTAAQSGILLSKEIFSGLRIQEILELIFFGSEYVVKDLDPYIFYLKEMIDTLDNETEFVQFAISKFGTTLEEAYNYVSLDDTYQVSVEDTRNLFKGFVDKDFQSTGAVRAKNLQWKGIVTPRGIPFKRRNNNYGVSFYVYGTPTVLDIAYGAKGISDFYNWNEIVHHRVRYSDLETMRNEYSSPANFNSSNMNVDQVIYTIGTDIINYPVGHGRVFYFAPAGLSDVTSEGVLDKGLNAGASLAAHSVFKDRLTLLYDAASSIDWRFYATPRGDLVFEHPFYDFDPKDFFGTKFQNSDLSDTDKTNRQRYDEIFQQQYSGKYTEDEAKELTSLSFELNTENVDLIDFSQPLKEGSFDYSKEFIVSRDEQISFSNTFSDRGMITMYLVDRNLAEYYKDLHIDRPYIGVVDMALVPTLGFRVDTGALNTVVGTDDGAFLSAALYLSRLNAESRSISVNIIPRFGLMVNRPIHLKAQNYYANIVSLTHSFVWNSGLTTSINLNSVRGWAGTIDKDGNPIYRHFYDRAKPFDYKEFMSRSTNRFKSDKQ